MKGFQCSGTAMAKVRRRGEVWESVVYIRPHDLRSPPGYHSSGRLVAHDGMVSTDESRLARVDSIESL